MAYIIRHMQDRDIPQVLEIDREAFPTQWPRPTYNSVKQELRNRLANYIVVTKSKQTAPFKLKSDDRSFWKKLVHLFDHDRFFGEDVLPEPKELVIGVAGFWVMVNEAHITTIAVRDAYRRQGIGERLLIAIIEMAIKLNADVVTLEVRASNKQAQALYEKYCFQRVGIRRAYYTDNGEDAILMSTNLLNSPAFKSHFQQLKQTHKFKWGEYINEISRVT